MKERIKQNINEFNKSIDKEKDLLGAFAIVVTEEGYHHFLNVDDSKGALVLLGYARSILKHLDQVVDKGVAMAMLKELDEMNNELSESTLSETKHVTKYVG